MEKPKLIKVLGWLYPNENSAQKRKYAIFECPLCGSEFKTIVSLVDSGNTKSCGCYNAKLIKERSTTHGLHKYWLYFRWQDIKKRCYNKTSTRYPYYGGRGIKMFEGWLNDPVMFIRYCESLPNCDKSLQIDRINNNSDYVPGNIRFVNRHIQKANSGLYVSNKTGVKGINFREDQGVYVARICVNRKRVHLGLFKDFNDAVCARRDYINKNKLFEYADN